MKNKRHRPHDCIVHGEVYSRRSLCPLLAASFYNVTATEALHMIGYMAPIRSSPVRPPYTTALCGHRQRYRMPHSSPWWRHGPGDVTNSCAVRRSRPQLQAPAGGPTGMPPATGEGHVEF